MIMSVLRPWRVAWHDRRFRAQFLITLPGVAFLLFAFSRFLEYVERRSGIVLQDPVLVWITPRDLTWVTNILIYGALALAIATLTRRPRQLLLALHAYVILVVFRMIVMFAAPLDHPEGMILLRDPLVEHFGPARILTRDLFFSGHAGTLFLLSLTATRTVTRRVLLASALLVGVCVVWQHVHYTIDVLAALAFSFSAYSMAAFFHRHDMQDRAALRNDKQPSGAVYQTRSTVGTLDAKHGDADSRGTVK
jgi:membrane-associated phospholipid phosphatase